MLKRFLLGCVVAAGLSGTANAALFYGVDENNNLVKYNSASLATGPVSSVAITGSTDSFQALDFRPRTNTLYGLGSDNTVYTINLTTGAATPVGGPLALTGTSFAFDFNPTIDRLRIVSNTNQNYVFNPNDGSLTNATNVFYQGSSANPDVVAAAYTSSTFGAPGNTTQLYGIDSASDQLVRQANSAGTLTAVGPLGFNLGTRASFDIAGADALVSNGTAIYSVNLGSGALTSLGTVDRQLFGLAIAAVPEPGTWAMLIGGFGVMGGVLRRRPRPAVKRQPRTA